MWRAHLEEGEWIRTLDMPQDSLSLLSPLDLLTQKKMIYIANVGETDIGNPGESEYVQSLVTHASRLKAQVVPLCAQLESEIALLESEEQGDFLRELGFVEPALHCLVRTTYDLLGYRSFFTAGEKGVRAWTIVSGQTAVEAAAKIHSDIARGFIAAEVIPWKELVDFGGSWARAREQGRCVVVWRENNMWFRTVMWCSSGIISNDSLWGIFCAMHLGCNPKCGINSMD
ncbi:DUF933 domain-containing protein [Pasteuria penetrans]|uniref:DUF933 domain-containing protein n=1 Tax=Pasteuria penetrans TaxID=86005 RepID=UPI0011EE5DED|nr:DUF933 domain-containing protein [Pasteuria penetrans]